MTDSQRVTWTAFAILAMFSNFCPNVKDHWYSYNMWKAVSGFQLIVWKIATGNLPSPIAESAGSRCKFARSVSEQTRPYTGTWNLSHEISTIFDQIIWAPRQIYQPVIKFLRVISSVALKIKIFQAYKKNHLFSAPEFQDTLSTDIYLTETMTREDKCQKRTRKISHNS